MIAFKPSDFAIINTDGSADFDIENKLTLRDDKERKMDLKLNYVYDKQLSQTLAIVLIRLQTLP